MRSPGLVPVVDFCVGPFCGPVLDLVMVSCVEVVSGTELALMIFASAGLLLILSFPRYWPPG